MKKHPKSLKILLVQDNIASAHWVQQMLQETTAFSFELTQLARLEAAITYLEAESVDVVLLELPLSEAEELTAINRVHGIAIDVPIIVMCDIEEEAIAAQALQYGAQEYLVKQQTNAQLLVRVLQYAIERQSWCSELQQTKLAVQQQTQSYRLLTEIGLRIQQSLHLDDILQTTLTEVRQFLQTDRVMIYRICPEEQAGVLVAESIAAGCHVRSEFWDLHRIWFTPTQTNLDKNHPSIVNNVYQQNYPIEYLELMMKLGITAKLVVPIVYNDKVWGLLAVHQCNEPRQWQLEEINLLKQLAIQTAIAIQQSELYEQVKLLNANLEQQVQERTQQLATEKALSQQILNSIREGIVVMRPDGQVLLTNPALSQIYGLELPENQRHLHEYLSRIQIRKPDGSFATLEELPISRTLRGEACTDHQLLVSCPNKEQKWVSINGATVRDQNGNIIFAVNTTREITLAKQAEFALKDSEARFRRLSEASFEGIMVHEQGLIIDANQALAAMFGRELSELIGTNAFELSLATPESLELIRKNIQCGNEKPYEVVGIRKDGSTFPLETQGKVIPYQGRIVQVEAIRDITELKHNEAKLRLYREIIANSNDAIAIIDPQGQYIEQNAAHRLLLGCSDNDLLGQTPEVFRCEKTPPFVEVLTELQKSGRWRGELSIRALNGAIIEIELSAFAVRDPADSTPLCYVGILRDITQRKQAEAALKQRDRLLESVAAATNHLLTTKDFAAGMTLALSALGKACDVDRVYICENQVEPNTSEPLMSQRFEWANSTVKTEIDNPTQQNLPYNFFSLHWYNNLRQGKTIQALVQDLPDSARKMLEEMEVISILLVPILHEGEFWGLLGFEDCHCERQWTETEQTIFTAAAGSIGGAIIRKRTEEALRKKERQLRRQSQALMELAKSKTFDRSNLNAALKQITETSAHTLEVERVSVWLYSSDHSRITCIELYEQSKNRHSAGGEIVTANYPAYFQTLESDRTIATSDALNDSRTQEFSKSYLSVFGITSLIDAPIWLDGQIVGIICHEHVGFVRQWTLEEQNFAGSIADFVSLSLEANNRQSKEQTLRQSEARFRAIFDNSGIGIALTNLDRQLLDCNLALCQILGYSKEELRCLKCKDYTHADDTDTDLEFFQQLFAGERDHYEIEKRCLHKDGRVVWVRLTVSLVQDQVGAQFAIGMMQDITERKQAEIQLRESKEAAEAGSRAKSAFLAAMSHELRTPLNAILGLSQLLQQEIFGTLNPKQKNYVDCIYRSGEHLLALINDILDLSKVEAGREELMFAPLVVQELCDYCVGMVSDRALAKGLQLICQIQPQVNVCIADERRLKQMLLNLLSNAIKFTDQGSVSLCVEKILQGIAFKVTDTGIGIAPEQYHSLFQPFKQLDSRLDRHDNGTGLGLALTRKLARLHGGDVTVESRLGEGSQFTLWLPDTPQNSEFKLQQERTSLENQCFPTCGENSVTDSSPRILIVEDDDYSRMLLQDYLQATGYQVEQMTEATNFLTQVRQFKPDLILLDFQLIDDVTGLDLLLRLRQQPDLQNLPVVMITAMAMAGDREQFLAAGANDYLTKPISINQLKAILMQYL